MSHSTGPVATTSNTPTAVATTVLSAGPISYTDSAGDGPVIVFVHGLLMNASLWDDVVALLSSDFRCVVPTLPLGAHGTPMNASADLSLSGIAELTSEFIDQLDLHDVTLVGNDTGGAIVQLLIASERLRTRIGRTVLVSCEAFDNVPPGLTGKTIVAMGKLPTPLFGVVMQQMRLKPMRRLPIAFGWLTKRGDRVTARWMRALLSNRGVRKDAVRVLRGIGSHRRVLVDATEQLREYPNPVLVVWAEGDRVMPPEHGPRLAELFPRGRLVEVADTYTLIPLDQPGLLAEHIRGFTVA